MGADRMLDFPPVDADVEHRYARIGDARIHYVEAGTGAPLVLLHGWPQHWWCWRHVIGPLAQTYRVICPDVRGLGWSEGSAGAYSFDRLAADVLDLLDDLDVRSVRLVGHDWGLAIGYALCLAHPERVSHFVPVAGVHPWSASGGPPGLWARLWHISLIATLGQGSLRGLRLPRHALRRWRHRGAFSRREERVYLRTIERPSAATATVGFYRNVMTRELPRYVVRHRSMRLETPTLHLLGAHDPLTQGVPASYRQYAPDMRLDTIEQCGHFVAEEAPEALLERVEPFLAS